MVQFIVIIILIMNDLLSNLNRIYIQNKVSSEVEYFQLKTERKTEKNNFKRLIQEKYEVNLIIHSFLKQIIMFIILYYIY